jgi:hypothetical protein
LVQDCHQSAAAAAAIIIIIIIIIIQWSWPGCSGGPAACWLRGQATAAHLQLQVTHPRRTTICIPVPGSQLHCSIIRICEEDVPGKQGCCQAGEADSCPELSDNLLARQQPVSL